MRRLLRAVARGEEITQDMSTLETPGSEQLRGVDSGPAAKKKTAKTASTRSVEPGEPSGCTSQTGRKARNTQGRANTQGRNTQGQSCVEARQAFRA